MTRIRAVGGRAFVALSVLLLVWSAATSSAEGPLIPRSTVRDRGGVIHSTPMELTTASDRPVLSGGGRRVAGPARALSPAAVLAGLVWLALLRATRSPSSRRLSRPLAVGLARRAPPAQSRL